MSRVAYLNALRCLAAIAILTPLSEAAAHTSEQGLVLLLPTDLYIAAGVLVVVSTLLLILLLPPAWFASCFKSCQLFRLSVASSRLQTMTSLLSLFGLMVLLYLGFTGTRDPLENPLPLFIWTVWWIGLPIIQGMAGDLWRWLNPWLGVLRLIRNSQWRAPFMLSQSLGYWPGVLIFLLFTSFALVDVAPDNPRRLSFFVGGYWCITLFFLLLFGEEWLRRGECFTMLMHRFAKLSPLGVMKFEEGIKTFDVGLMGWKLKRFKPTSFSASIFILILLGCGSFDGLNETFLWLSLIDVNPLEFPGRSAVIGETVAGLLSVNLILILIYGFCILVGVHIANRSVRVNSPANGQANKQVCFKVAFCALSISLLPIAYAYHFAHYLVALLVNGQYAVAAVSDPLGNGADLFNLGSYYVTTGFMNTPATVKTIWLTQAGVVVIGHVLSVLLGHAVAVELFGNARRAIVSQALLAAFMVGYTFIGLWLLAAPKGA